ncbi:hypothetical protein MMC16_007257 [Acarospora aff. strigata]|nr:hypothetical protein [Acarospora aff. strigata]
MGAMPARADTTFQTYFTRPGSVTYDLSTPDSVTITLPPGSYWSSGLHWHETHTEFLQVIKGSAEVTLDGRTRNFVSEDGIIVVKRSVQHEWKRARPSLGTSASCRDSERERCEDDEELVVREWTDPRDGMKELFFRNLNSVIMEPGNKGLWFPDRWIGLQILVVSQALDNYPVFVQGRAARLVTCSVFVVVRLLALIFGLEPVYLEYTPASLVDSYEGRRTVDRPLLRS